MISALNQLVDYIDGHLTEEIAVDDLAVSLGMTEYHLRRMFSSLAGMPLSEYVRRRRMTVATARRRRSAERSDRCTASARVTCAGTAAPFARNRSSGSA